LAPGHAQVSERAVAGLESVAVDYTTATFFLERAACMVARFGRSSSTKRSNHPVTVSSLCVVHRAIVQPVFDQALYAFRRFPI
jgi:hypothetical protein